VPKPVEIGGFQIDDKLYALVRDEIALGTGIEPDVFWVGLSKIVHDLGPTNRALLDERDRLQRRIDSWCLSHRGQPFNVAEYQAFLETIGCLVRDGENFQVVTENLDREIAGVSGPQLVVPLDNAP
jgi:malate synthase